MLKLLLHYQGIIRVPFIWSDTQLARSGQLDTGLGSSIDIAPTILARAGIEPFNGIQGRDLLSTPSPDAIIIEEDSQCVMTGFDRPQRARTIVTDQFRMSLREGEDWNELYDLGTDPHEIDNLYDQPSALTTRQLLSELMLRQLIYFQDRSPLPAYRA